MDNDVRNTEYCIGFSTAITRAMDAIQRQRTTVGSHERVGIFRVFGRDAGFTALYTAYVTSIRCCIPEYKVNLDKLIDILMEEKRNTPSNYVLVVISEGAQWEGYKVQEYGEPDAFGHRKKASVGEALATEIGKRTGEECIVSDLTYDLRSGEPDFVDKLIAATFGNIAMDAVLAGQERADGRAGARLLHAGADSRSGAGPAQGGCRHHVQHGPLPAQLRQQDGLADLPDATRLRRLHGLLDRLDGPVARPSGNPRLPKSAPFSTARPATRSITRPPSIPRIFHVKLVLEHLGDCMAQAGASPMSAAAKAASRASSRSAIPTRHVIALDLAEAMLAHVPADLQRVAASMTALPACHRDAMDAAYATESLEHAVDIPAAVAELARIVQPGRAHRHHRQERRGLGTP